MSDELGAVEVLRKTGDETFHHGGAPTNESLREFWRWSSSDLLSNAMRGVLAEYIVGLALGCVEGGTRREWDAADLVTPGNLRVEVKSAAYLQTWLQHRLSPISFRISPTNGWDAATNTISDERRRQADVYVFAVLTHQSKRTVDPLDLDQWEFHVLPTDRLNEAVPHQRTISLSRLLSLQPRTVLFDGLASAVETSTLSS
jgi:hypothetical protein